MKAEFRSEDLGDLPDLVITTDDKTEWRALQLFMRLMDSNRVRLTFEFNPPLEDEDPEEEDDEGEDPEEVLP